MPKQMPLQQPKITPKLRNIFNIPKPGRPYYPGFDNPKLPKSEITGLMLPEFDFSKHGKQKKSKAYKRLFEYKPDIGAVFMNQRVKHKKNDFEFLTGLERRFIRF